MRMICVLRKFSPLGLMLGAVIVAATAGCGIGDPSEDVLPHGGGSSSSSGGRSSSSGSSSSGAHSSSSGGSSSSSSSGSSGGAASSSSGGSSSSGAASSSSSGSHSSSSSGASSSSSSGSASSSSGASSSGGAKPSAGCGKTPTLKNTTSGAASYNSIQSGGQSRQYLLRLPANYDKNRPYRLILGFHGATGKATDLSPGYFGLYDLSSGSTIFAAPDAVGGIWSADSDTKLVDAMLKQIEADLCVDTTRVMVEGFSQGGAMGITLGCGLPNVFRAAIIHSAGGLPVPSTCEPIAWLSTLGNDGSGQGMTSDFMAKTAGCTVEPLPKAPSGGHVCTNYKGCSEGHPVRWCPYDGGHTPSPADSGKRDSWVPAEVWSFLSQF